MYSILSNKSVSDGKIMHGDRRFLVDDGRITGIGVFDDFDKGDETVDLRGLTVMPGFIDIHVHGAMGYDVMDGTAEALEAVSLHKIQEGCTSFCPTTVTAPWDKTLAAVKNIRDALAKGLGGARAVGAFLEGPCINPIYKGAHPEEYIRAPDFSAIKELVDAGGGFGGAACVIIAPELPGALSVIKELTAAGVRVRVGHSAATFEETEAAVAAGADLAVHSYNTMSALRHREPGMVGAILTNPSLRAELICDLVHVHAGACKVLAGAKGGGGVVLITDCMAAGGLDDGEYRLGELAVLVKDGVSRLPDGTIAGSTTTMLRCVRNMHLAVGVPFEEAVQMATATPARALGLHEETGSLDLGKCADIIALDDNFELRFVMVGGEIKKWV